MATLFLQRLITTPFFLKIVSCIMGFFAWYVISSSHTLQRECTLPLYFDNLHSEHLIEAPDTINMTLQATRAALARTKKEGAVHINAEKLSTGTQLIFPARENMLLPAAVKVVNYNPIKLTLTPVST